MSHPSLAGGAARGDNNNGWGSSNSSGRERGARRKKVYEYLKAANELRQSYTAQWTQKGTYEDDGFDMRGAYPDVGIAQSGGEEMIIFPSYARQHIKMKSRTGVSSQQTSETEEDMERERSRSPTYQRQGSDEFEDETAVVDVDVRGWLYAPQRGPMTRKHRLLIALARKLSGIPAPSADPNENSASSQLNFAESQAQNRTAQEDDDDIKEAQSIINKAEKDASMAWKGYSAETRNSHDPLSRTTTQSSLASMGKDELTLANVRLMERLWPFMTNPLVGTPVTMFFFSEERSQSRTTSTNVAGHFSLRVPLDFLPTHVRVLASDTLSMVEEVHVIKPKGVSLISDIDDTIKHSAILNGAKEIFRNTFVRELADLKILGVKEWYSKLADMEVRMHYVSNAPWQLYPLLKTYFKLAGLPPGSFHLKQYSGMLQGIFEPTAERKKSALERIMRDFPERQFILIGDSGEADLEVYTDLVVSNPGRVLGIFIRNITTTEKNDFFDKSFNQQESRNLSYVTGTPEDDSDALENKPSLPPRRSSGHPNSFRMASSLDNADLIFIEESTDENPQKARKERGSIKQPPVKPLKPNSLRTAPSEPVLTMESQDSAASNQNFRRKKPAPPIPSRPPRLSTPTQEPSPDQPPSLPTRPHQGRSSSSFTPGRDQRGSSKNASQSYGSSIKHVASNVYSGISSAKEYQNQRPGDSETSAQTSRDISTLPKQPPPVPPPRRSTTMASSSNQSEVDSLNRRQRSHPIAAATATAEYHLRRSSSPSMSKMSPQTSVLGRTNTNSTYNSEFDGNSAHSNPFHPPPPSTPNKREEMWKRRWERAEEILSDYDVVLGSWRVGSDVQDICVWLVEKALKDLQTKQGSCTKWSELDRQIRR
ncbi:hypothetical protein Egran_05172 [Elaphomyces granulatus]|uniref:Phosphatidate phosphatase APP1 catalytic domain-containing protein n=1 Tax=Elaphomyces granulatus TaxID=519963 RepID=A0A232LSB5_9EURO|nr:hypothetical protein Egran_05172 [Elaphomyces granulatus]